MITLPKKLDAKWKKHFKKEFAKDYMQSLQQFLQEEQAAGQVVFPSRKNCYNAFQSAPLDNVKVVIIGQDPYHGKGQAHGLSFSVEGDVKIPPSLRNIYKELNRDLNIDIPVSGNLQDWANQGVLLLNSCLTVREAQAGSHSKKGWETFTNSCIELINREKTNVVFLAWGKFAHGVCENIDTTKHCVIKTSHPSPLGASKQGNDFVAFTGSGCFSEGNAYLKKHGLDEIDWNLHPNFQLL